MMKEPTLIKRWTISSKGVAKAVERWSKGGFTIADEKLYNDRKSVCATCEEWDTKGFFNMGKCNQCGCNTAVKLKLATESCPLGKWKAVNKKEEQ